MAFTLFFSMAMFLFVAFVCLRKNMHRQEYVFVWLGVVVVFITAFDAATLESSNYFKMPKQALPFVAHRVWEILVIPLVLLLYLNYERVMKKWWRKLAVAAVCFIVLYGLELLAVACELIRYVKWKPWWSPIAWLMMIALAMFLQKSMRALLRREGKVR
ncbi:MAG: hypothetical protein WCC10_18010 [Tumebacillaceae bacterium]